MHLISIRVWTFRIKFSDANAHRYPRKPRKACKKMNDKSSDFKNTCFDRSEPVLSLRFALILQ